MPLVTLAEMKPYLRIDLADVSNDPLLTTLRDAMESQFINALGWNPERRTYSERVDGFGDVSIFTSTPFVVSIQNLWVRSNFDGDPNVFVDEERIDPKWYRLVLDRPVEGFTYSMGTIQRLNGIWPDSRIRRIGRLPSLHRSGLGNIRIDYTAGFQTIPTDIKLAITQLVKQQLKFQSTGGLPIITESHNDYSYALGEVTRNGDLGSIQRVINFYKRWTIFS